MYRQFNPGQSGLDFGGGRFRGVDVKADAAKRGAAAAAVLIPATVPALPYNLPLATATTVNWLTLGLTFSKVGVVFFGGGFVLIPVLKQLLIDQLHWLTVPEFLDGVAISQLTPGPIAVIATFAGFRVGGWSGAMVATLGLFLPATVLMLLLSHSYQRFRHLQPVKHFLAGVNPAVVGMVVSAAVHLAPSVFPMSQPLRLGVNMVLLGLTWLVVGRFKKHPALALGMGAAVGALLG